MTLSIIIPAAGTGHRFRSRFPKALARIGGEPLIARQARLLRELNPAEIIVVGGFRADLVRRALPDDVRVVINGEYEETNVAFSILRGLRAARGDTFLIVYGDLVFGPSTLTNLRLENSTLLYCHQAGGREIEVGINHDAGSLRRLAFGLTERWAHVALLRGREAELFTSITTEPRRHRHFGYEVVNQVMERGGSFSVAPLADEVFAEVDVPADLAKAQKVIGGEAPQILQFPGTSRCA